MTSSPELEEIQMVFPEVLSGFCGKSKSQAGNIFQTKTRIHLVLNELDACKYATLKSHCEAYVADNPILQRLPLDIECYNEDVASLFLKKINQMRKNPALVYLGQNGVKFLADKYLLELEKMKTTDFMFCFMWRSLAGAVHGSKTDSCLCGVFVPGKRFIWNKMGRAKGFVPLKTFSRDQMKVLFHVSVFLERNHRGKVHSPRGGI